MRHMRTEEIHSAAYSARIEAVQALRDAGLGSQNDAARLNQAADNIKSVSELYGAAPNASVYLAFSELIRISGLLSEWRSTVLGAGVDAQRFLVAARERASAWLKTYSPEPPLERLRAVAGKVTQIQAISEVALTVVELAAVPLPVGLYHVPTPDRWGSDSPPTDEKTPVELTVAFLKFTIDGMPVTEVQYVSPGEAHDLDIEVRVSRWPSGASALLLEPLTIEALGTYQMPVFSIPAPTGEGPFKLTQKGRAVLAVPQNMNARPFEFKYVAKFVPTGSEQPVDIVGQRTLLLEGLDLAHHPLTGYSNLDRKVIAIRDQLRRIPGISQHELTDALALVAPLVNFAGQVVQDNRFDSEIPEAEFQKVIKQFLRSQSTIGADLEEHAHAAGGETDLSFKGIRLELKSEPSKRLILEDCEQFLEQTTSYVVASGRRLGVLCVLDCSKKKEPVFPVEDAIGVLVRQASNTPIYVITILMQGNLARPSSFSR